MLFLLPNVLHEQSFNEEVFPPHLSEAISSLDGIIAESEKAARGYLRRFLPREKFSVLPISLLNEHTAENEIEPLLSPLLAGETWGLISDAGLPCLADPGAQLVQKAKRKNIPVRSIWGPCSFILALQLSGLGGQRFSFHGYLPRELALLEHKLRAMETDARQNGFTHIWIEAPYRSFKMAKFAIEILQPSTFFCIASQLTSPKEQVITHKISQWRKMNISLNKDPSVFLLSSPND